MTDLAPLDALAAPTLKTTLLWEAVVEVEGIRALGQGAYGERRIVPITGGRFRGGADMDGFAGRILPGGADRQLIRADGGKELDALYEMETEAGEVITVHNKVIIDETVEGPRYALSSIAVSAPEGRWDWLNRRIILGTLQPVTGGAPRVIIRGYLAEVEHR